MPAWCSLHWTCGRIADVSARPLHGEPPTCAAGMQVAAEALRVCEQLVRVVRPSVASPVDAAMQVGAAAGCGLGRWLLWGRGLRHILGGHMPSAQAGLCVRSPVSMHRCTPSQCMHPRLAPVPACSRWCGRFTTASCNACQLRCEAQRGGACRPAAAVYRTCHPCAARAVHRRLRLPGLSVGFCFRTLAGPPYPCCCCACPTPRPAGPGPGGEGVRHQLHGHRGGRPGRCAGRRRCAGVRRCCAWGLLLSWGARGVVWRSAGGTDAGAGAPGEGRTRASWHRGPCQAGGPAARLTAAACRPAACPVQVGALAEEFAELPPRAAGRARKRTKREHPRASPPAAAGGGPEVGALPRASGRGAWGKAPAPHPHPHPHPDNDPQLRRS